MDLIEARALAIQHMDEHDLISKGWTFKYNKSGTTYGKCNYRKRSIQLSGVNVPFMKYEDVLDTILHEIAHALDLIENGYCSRHGANWKAICRRIGADPKSCHNKLDNNARVIREANTSYKYALILTTNNEVIKKFQKRPKVMDRSNSYIRGQKRATLGKLKIITINELEEIENKVA